MKRATMEPSNLCATLKILIKIKKNLHDLKVDSIHCIHYWVMFIGKVGELAQM